MVLEALEQLIQACVLSSQAMASLCAQSSTVMDQDRGRSSTTGNKTHKARIIKEEQRQTRQTVRATRIAKQNGSDGKM